MVSMFAFFITTLVVIISARLSQKKRKDELMDEIKRYNELSKDASDLDAGGLYAAFQKQGNETLMYYFVAVYKEAVVELAVHVLAMGLLQSYYSVRVLNFPVNVWGLGDGLGTVGWYIISAIVFFYIVIRPLKTKVKLFRPGWV